MSAASFLHSSFLQAIDAVMLWPVRVKKVPQVSEHLCPAKLQTRCDICCACQSICLFIPTDSGVPRTVEPDCGCCKPMLYRLSLPRVETVQQNGEIYLEFEEQDGEIAGGMRGGGGGEERGEQEKKKKKKRSRTGEKKQQQQKE